MTHVLEELNLKDLYTACEQGQKPIVDSVIELLSREVKEVKKIQNASLDLDCSDLDGNTALLLAAWQGHQEICALLKSKGARETVAWCRHKPSGDGVTCLGTGFWQGRIARHGWTPVHAAAWQGHDQVIKALLPEKLTDSSKGYRDKRGDTPLHVAVQAGQMNVASTLLTKCRDWKIAINKAGKTPRRLAEERHMLHEFDNACSRSEATRGRDAPNATKDHETNNQSMQQDIEFARSSSEATSGSGAPNRTTDHETNTQGQREAPYEEGWKTLKFPCSPGLCSYIAVGCGGALAQLTMYHRDQLSLDDLRYCDVRGNVVRHQHLARINRGSMGEVCRVKNIHTHEQYAQKVFSVLVDETGRQRAMQGEVNVATEIRHLLHPCIIRLHGIFCDQHDDYTIVMELAENDLDQILMQRNGGRTTDDPWDLPDEWLDWIGQIVLGIEYVHHRVKYALVDLKPQNVLLGRRKCCKLTDFGDWMPLSSHVTGKSTPGFAAPEIYETEPVCYTCVDMYSLGGIVWLLLTGGKYRPRTLRPPFDGVKSDADIFCQLVILNFPEFQLPAQPAFQTTEFPDCTFELGTTCRSCSQIFVKLLHVRGEGWEGNICEGCWENWNQSLKHRTAGMMAAPDPDWVSYKAPQFDWTEVHNFVYKAVQRKPESRLTLQDARNHPLLASLGLPQPGASPDGWLRRRGFL
eukprot:TRINITY_DN8284_c0_g1_i2.p1 TRINITY_DN8284_c0_g1~~TRINITY_DN8284_c0_g1_i2.p1  ORF type:complete len:691 (-),score=64.75 TRINITY_DN8284_c0_g1_i2:322-2394(-)